MGFFTQLLLMLGAGLVIWYLIRTIRSNPQAFSKEMFGKSFYTMGILAVLLIGFISLCIYILRAT
jgi:hypothetical protein